MIRAPAMRSPYPRLRRPAMRDLRPAISGPCCWRGCSSPYRWSAPNAARTCASSPSSPRPLPSSGFSPTSVSRRVHRRSRPRADRPPGTMLPRAGAGLGPPRPARARRRVRSARLLVTAVFCAARCSRPVLSFARRAASIASQSSAKHVRHLRKRPPSAPGGALTALRPPLASSLERRWTQRDGCIS